MLWHFSIISSSFPTAPVAFLSLLLQPAQQRDMLVLQGLGRSFLHQPCLSSFPPWSPQRFMVTVPGSAGNSAETPVCGTTSAPREGHRVAGARPCPEGSTARQDGCHELVTARARGVFSTARGNVTCPRQEKPEVPSVTLSFLYIYIYIHINIYK